VPKQSPSTRHPAADVIIPAADLGDRARWLAARRTGVTATDARVLAGFPYSDESVYSHWKEKFADPDAAEGSVPLRWRLGTDLEPVIARYAAEALGVTTARVGMLRSRQWPFVIASPDRTCSCDGLVELKATDRMRLATYRGQAGEVNADGWVLPPGWWVQGAHQILVSGRDHVHFAALLGRDDVTTWTVQYPETELRLVLARAELFWEQVLSGVAPPVQWDTVTVAEMKLRYPAAAVPSRVLTAGELAAATELLRARQDLKAAAKYTRESLDAVENQLRELIGDTVELWADPEDSRPLLRYPVTATTTLKKDLLLKAYPGLDLSPALVTTFSRSFTAVQKMPELARNVLG
jgi:predicted phage-related endonuclease